LCIYLKNIQMSSIRYLTCIYDAEFSIIYFVIVFLIGINKGWQNAYILKCSLPQSVHNQTEMWCYLLLVLRLPSGAEFQIKALCDNMCIHSQRDGPVTGEFTADRLH